MSGHWTAQRERGTVLSMKMITWIAVVFGRSASCALLYPVCFYFMLFAPGATRASREYLTRLFGRRPIWREVFRHYYAFAIMLLDRALLLAGQEPDLVIRGEGYAMVSGLADSGRGCLMLGAHLGSFEVARFQTRKKPDLTINMMMYEENAQKVNAVFESLGGRSRMKVIPIGGVDSLLRAKDRLDAGEWVGILGDRLVASERVVHVPFLGSLAAFPAGPFLMASTLKVPVVLFASLYLGGNRYQEFYELFAEEIVIDRRQREADLEKWVRRYAERLEHYCRLAPYNWFNFYDFWDSAPQAEPAGSLARSAG